MKLISIILVLILFIQFSIKLYTRTKIKKQNQNIASSYSRTKYPKTPTDILRLILFAMLSYQGYTRVPNDGLTYILAVIIIFTIYHMKRLDKITITDEYIFFNMTYLKLTDIDDIYIDNNKYLVIDSKKLIFNTKRIEYIEKPNQIVEEVKKLLNK